MELIFKTLEDPMTLLKIKIPKIQCRLNDTLYIGIYVRRMWILSSKCKFFTLENFQPYNNFHALFIPPTKLHIT